MCCKSFLLILSVAAQTQSAQLPGKSQDPRCGAYCLYIALKAIGLADLNYDQIEKELGKPNPDGYSMHDLARVAEVHGAKTLAVETSFDHLSYRTEPFVCIALLSNPNHYVLFYDRVDSLVYIVDPPKHEYSIPITLAKNYWTKKALLVGKLPFQPEESIVKPIDWKSLILGSIVALISLIALIALLIRYFRIRDARRMTSYLVLAILTVSNGSGCDRPKSSRLSATREDAPGSPSLMIDHETVKLGDIPIKNSGAIREVKSKINNQGSSELWIKEIHLSCTCSKASIDRVRIPPGAYAEITARIQLGDVAEERSSVIEIVSNDPRMPTAAIRYSWRIVNPLLSVPQSVSIPFVRLGTLGKFDLDLKARGLSLCRQCRLEAQSSDPSLEVEIHKTSISSIADHSSSSMTDVRDIAQIRLLIHGDFEGEYPSRSIGFRWTCRDQIKESLTLPVSWTVSSPIQISPGRLALFSQDNSAMLVGRSILNSSDQLPFKILDIRCENRELLQSVDYDKTSAKRHSISLRFRSPAPGEFWRTSIVIVTDRNDSLKLTFPVSAFAGR